MLSSRRLLNLIDGLRDDSRYKTAAERDGEFTEQELWSMRLFNELANMHHTLQAVNADPEKWEDYEPPRFLSRTERVTYWAEKHDEADEETQAAEEFYAEMWGP